MASRFRRKQQERKNVGKTPSRKSTPSATTGSRYERQRKEKMAAKRTTPAGGGSKGIVAAGRKATAQNKKVASTAKAKSSPKKTPTKAPAASKPTFKEAFASARKAGKKVFTWNGKRYTTELASDKKKTPSKSGSSKSKPAPKKATSYGATSGFTASERAAIRAKRKKK